VLHTWYLRSWEIESVDEGQLACMLRLQIWYLRFYMGKELFIDRILDFVSIQLQGSILML
jgi:hypothetical protein